MVGRLVKLYYFVIIVIILFGLIFQFQHGMARPLQQHNDEDQQNINTNSVVISSTSAHNKKVIISRTRSVLEEINNSGPSPGEGHKQQLPDGYHH